VSPAAGSRPDASLPLVALVAPAIARLVPATAGALAWGGVVGALLAAAGWTWNPWHLAVAPLLVVLVDRLGAAPTDEGAGSTPTARATRTDAREHLPVTVVRASGAFVTLAPDDASPSGVHLLISAAAASLLPAEELAAVCRQREAFAAAGGARLTRAIAHGARAAARAEELLLAPWRTRTGGTIAAILLLPIVPAIAAGLVLIRWACRAASLIVLRPALRAYDAQATHRCSEPPALLLRAAARLDLLDGVPAGRPAWEPGAIGGPSTVGGAFAAVAPDFATRHAHLVALGADTMGGTSMTRPSWLLGTAAGGGRFLLVPLAALAALVTLAGLAAGPLWLALQALDAARILGDAARHLLGLAPTP
jgi:hypothetical protein